MPSHEQSSQNAPINLQKDTPRLEETLLGSENPTPISKNNAQTPNFFTNKTQQPQGLSAKCRAAIWFGGVGLVGAALLAEPVAWGIGIILFGLSPTVFVTVLAIYAAIVATSLVLGAAFGTAAYLEAKKTQDDSVVATPQLM